jgi:hypothetical protein
MKKAEGNSATANQLPVETEELFTCCQQFSNYNITEYLYGLNET